MKYDEFKHDSEDNLEWLRVETQKSGGVKDKLRYK